MRVSESDAQQEMELSGTAAELRELARLVRAGDGGAQLDTAGDPSPYDRLLPAVEVRDIAGAAVVIRNTGTTLALEGGVTARTVLAEIMEDLAADEPGADAQIDYYAGHPYLGAGSRPVIIVLAG